MTYSYYRKVLECASPLALGAVQDIQSTSGPAHCRTLTRRLTLALISLCLVGANVVVAGGVTLITHGFNSDVASWIIPMQGRIAQYGGLSPTNTACYEIEITQNGQGQYVSTATLLSGTNPLAAASGEVLIKLNWSTLSGLGGPATTTIAVAAAQAMLATNLIPALGGRALVEAPLHLVGHSRGASVVAELSRLLGAQGVWVDQLTALDPVPVASFGDPAMQLYANVLFVDNYWQSLGVFLDPQGQSLAGAYNRKLTNLSGAAFSAHSDVHLWYHGTIDFATPLTVDGATISSTERQNWWTSLEQRGTNTGLRLSLIGGGNRLSTNELAGAGNGRINDGMNKLYNFGAGLVANRAALPVNSGAWPNLLLLSHSATNPLPAGSALEVSLHHQSGTNTAATLAISLDQDANPYNGNETPLRQALLSNTGTNNVLVVVTNAPTDARTLSPGSYRLLARVTAAGRTRYLYAPTPVMVTPSVLPPWLTSLGLTNNAFRFRVNGYAGQTVLTEASSNLTQWTAIATNLVSGSGFEILDPQTVGMPARFFRAVLVP